MVNKPRYREHQGGPPPVDESWWESVLAEDEAQYYRSRVEYAVGLKNVHFEKGTLLDYLGVACAEGPWPDEAYDDAARREANRGFFWRPRSRPPIISTDGTTAVESPFPVQELIPAGSGIAVPITPASSPPAPIPGDSGTALLQPNPLNQGVAGYSPPAGTIDWTTAKDPNIRLSSHEAPAADPMLVRPTNLPR